ITRSEDDASAWADALTRAGAEAVVLPCIDAEPIVDAALATALRDAARRADWVVFTSRRGVEAFVRLVGTTSTKARVAAVGPATGAPAAGAWGAAAAAGGRAGGEPPPAARPEPAPPAGGPAPPRPRPAGPAPAATPRAFPGQSRRGAGTAVGRFAVYRPGPAA